MTEPAATPGFAPVVEEFQGWLDADASYSGQLAVFHRGDLVVDIAIGEGIAPDSLVPVFSSGKGAIGVVIASLVEAGQLDLDATVCAYWPEFAAADKATVTVRQLLSHQAGLLGVDGGFTDDELLDHTPLAERLAAQRPLWRPGSAFGYHAFTIGTLADELVRRVTGRTLRQVFEEHIATPYGIDVHLGTGPELDDRVVTVDLPSEQTFAEYLGRNPAPEPDSLRAMSGPHGGHSLLSRVNDDDYRRVGPPAVGALATARGLASLYRALRHGHDRREPLLSVDTMGKVSQLQVSGLELGTQQPLRFAVAFQLPCPPRSQFGSARAFGHDGASGSLGYYDPHYDLAVGYVPKRVHLPPDLALCPDERMRLTQTIRACANAVT